MKKRTKRCLAISLIAIALAGVSLAPTIWRYSAYRKARLTIESGDEAQAIRMITRLQRNPMFDLDWTIQGTVHWIPHGYMCYEKLVGCPSCRGDFYTLLYHSAYNGHVNLTRTMLDLGAPLERWNDKGERVLRAAVISKNPRVVELVIDSGADVNAVDADPVGFTALHIAMLVRSPEELVALLLHKGADINLRNNKGQTSLDYALLYNADIVPFLTAHGAVTGGSGPKNTRMHNNTSEGIRRPADGSPKPSM